MKKTLLIAGALLLATTATSAFAQGRPYYGGGYGYYGGAGSYADSVRQLRACQRHARLHRELGAEHAEEHAEGLEGPGDHHDLHEALEDAHEAYHEDHPQADLCNRIGYANRYRANPYPYGYVRNGYYGNGMSFGFGLGR
jgi:hypothetical protein